MNSVGEPAVGDVRAYRARRGEPLAQVIVVRYGVKTPRRVLVRFVEDEFEGRQNWVPPARLKALWHDVDAYMARERRRDAVVGASLAYDAPEESAASIVFDLLMDSGLATLGYNATRGVVKIHDVEGLAAFLDLDPVDLRADPLSFEEDGDLIAPWSVTYTIARRAAERDPHAILRHVEREEAQARRETVFGTSYPKRAQSKTWDVSPETCAQVDEEHGKPVRVLLREWCGQEAVDLRGELVELRKEVARLAALAQSALDAMRRDGHIREADRLEGEFGPVGGRSRPH